MYDLSKLLFFNLSNVLNYLLITEVSYCIETTFDTENLKYYYNYNFFQNVNN